MFWYIVAASSLVAYASAQSCVVDGLDLATALGTATLSYSSGLYIYYVTVCKPLTSAPAECTAARPDSGSCQYEPSAEFKAFDCGDYNQAIARRATTTDSPGVTYVVNYPPQTTANFKRGTKIEITCDNTALESTIVNAASVAVPGVPDENEIQVSIKSPCNGGAPVPPPEGKSKWSFGDAMCLVIPLCLVFYFVGGMIFLKFVKGAESWSEAIPNKSFWGAIPGLVMDGIRFIRDKTCGGGSGGSAGAGSDYDRL